MRPAIRKRITKSGLLWIAIAAIVAALGCAGSSEFGEGDEATSGRGSDLLGEEVGGSEFERYGGAMGSELSASERDALGLQTVYFAFDEFSLSGTARETLRRDAEILRSHPEILVEIQGNCDDRGSEEYNLALGERRARAAKDYYNLALGERRARAAKDYLVNSGISRQRISTVSFGESNPATMGQSERAWQLNRRDDFVPKR
jgi:peptidoglycan-associated lipoprotein